LKLKLKAGDTVRVVGSHGTAKIRAILTSMHGALPEKQIDGFRRWNLDELRSIRSENLSGTAEASSSAAAPSQLTNRAWENQFWRCVGG
jgi:hypothetical protein